MKKPSLNNENSLTWKCNFFGCKNELLPASWYDSDERHGIKNCYFTATTIVLSFSFKGCNWCGNYRKILNYIDDTFPKWKCDCEICI